MALFLYDTHGTFTDTSTKISSMEVAQWLQSVDIVDRQATFTDTISSMVIALCLQSVAELRPWYLFWWKYL